MRREGGRIGRGGGRGQTPGRDAVARIKRPSSSLLSPCSKNLPLSAISFGNRSREIKTVSAGSRLSACFRLQREWPVKVLRHLCKDPHDELKRQRLWVFRPVRWHQVQQALKNIVPLDQLYDGDGEQRHQNQNAQRHEGTQQN
eukprot:CAMPEP_0204121146 /NCGR_PEP_ID=MMETSP0361-20130328/8042_1 /ASSEMBLY_ACC=CAM_ASM_000343 /TAXON_ID=268821 /ORGANISM="Scrippsiella Hangoei, Strain SHTV-5" /LENGTH=142 /DNA_ID=CAMNT_0051072419 /DNA_START=41 /DNA_END=469 /DNA_ORIENTATION=-